MPDTVVNVWRPTHADPFPPIIESDPPDLTNTESWYRSIARALLAGGKDDDERFKRKIRRAKVAPVETTDA